MHLQCILILDNFYNFSKNLGFCVSQIQVTCRRIDLLYLGYWEIYKKGIPKKYIDIITYQILYDITFYQKENIIHRDLKPSNILINSKGKIRISNIGISTIVEGY